MTHRLLVDNNLSHKLVEPLRMLGFEAIHVKTVGLQESNDYEIWDYATTNAFNILTKDSDFGYIVALRGFSPKVIQLDIGNKSTSAIIKLLEKNIEAINLFLADNESGLLVLI